MKKILFFGILILSFFLITGFGCAKEDKTIDKTPIEEISNDNNQADTIEDTEFEEGRILVDRVRYVQAGTPPSDSTNVIFQNKKDNGYRAEISSDKDIKVEVMTDKDCLLKGQGEKYNILKEDRGSNVVIIGEKNQDESRNLCIDATATGSGQIEIKFKVVELI